MLSFWSFSLLHQLLIPGIILFLWGIVSWGWPAVSVILLSAFFPFYFGPVKFTVYGVPFTLIEWMIYVSFFIYILRSLLAWNRSREGFMSNVSKQFYSMCRRFSPSGDWRRSLWTPITLILIGLLLPLVSSLFEESSLAGMDRTMLLGILKGWFIAPLMYFYLMQHVLPGLKAIRRCFEWYTISAVFLSLWGILQFVFHFTVTPDGRVSGPFESANYLALYIMPAAVFVLVRLWHILSVPREYDGLVGLFRKLFHVEDSLSVSTLVRYGFFAGMLLFAMYLTRSFGAFLGLFGALFGYGIYHFFFSYWKVPFRKALLWCSVVFVGLAVVGGIFFVTGDRGKFNQMFNVAGRSSSSVRLQVWTVAGDLIGKNFFLGVGAGQFERLYGNEATKILGREPYEKTMLHPHNIFLMFWLSSGLVGLVGFVWLLVLLFLQVIRMPKHDGVKRMALVCLTMLVAILLHGMVDTPMWKNDLALEFWMIVGALASLQKLV